MTVLLGFYWVAVVNTFGRGSWAVQECLVDKYLHGIL